MNCRLEIDKSDDRSHLGPTDKIGNNTTDNTILQVWLGTTQSLNGILGTGVPRS